MFWANFFPSSLQSTSEEFKKAREALIKSSCDLVKQVNVVPFCRFWFCPSKFYPSKKAILESAKDLRGLSTYWHETDLKEYKYETIGKIVAKIEKNLNLESLE